MLRYLAFRLAGAAVIWLPLSVGYALASWSTGLAYLLNREGRAAARANMRHVLGNDASAAQVEAETRRVFRNVLAYYVDLLRTRRLRPVNFDRARIIDHGYENLTGAIEAGRGVVLCSAHFGNPDLVGQVLLSRGVPALVITEPLQPPALSRFFDAQRSAHGHRFLPANRATLREALRTLRSGGVVGVMFDRGIQGRTIVIDLCGAPASVPVGAVELAQRTGAAIVPVFTRRRIDKRFDVWVEPPLDLARTGDRSADTRANVEALFARFVPYLRADPSQWLALRPVWSDRASPPGGDPLY